MLEYIVVSVGPFIATFEGGIAVFSFRDLIKHRGSAKLEIFNNRVYIEWSHVLFIRRR